MRKGPFDCLVASVTEMKEIQAGRLEPARVTRVEDLVAQVTHDVASPGPDSASSLVQLRVLPTGPVRFALNDSNIRGVGNVVSRRNATGLKFRLPVRPT